MPDSPARRRWLRYSLGQLLIFSVGFAIGLGALQMWQHHRPVPRIKVQTRVYELPRRVVNSLGLDRKNEGDMAFFLTDTLDPLLLSKLESLEKKNVIRRITDPTLVIPDGMKSSFSLGGVLPYPDLAATSSPKVDHMKFQTTLDVSPTILPDGRIRMELYVDFGTEDFNYVGGMKRRAVDWGGDIINGGTGVLGMRSDWSPNGEPDGAFIVVLTPTIQR